MARTRTITFDQIWGFANADVACRHCGRVNRRTIREWCTVNPFNRDDAGNIKDRAQVRDDARKRAETEAQKQVAEGRVCRICAARPLAPAGTP